MQGFASTKSSTNQGRNLEECKCVKKEAYLMCLAQEREQFVFLEVLQQAQKQIRNA